MFHEKAHKEPPWNAPHGRCMQKGGSVIEDIMVTDTLASQLHSFFFFKTRVDPLLCIHAYCCILVKWMFATVAVWMRGTQVQNVLGHLVSYVLASKCDSVGSWRTLTSAESSGQSCQWYKQSFLVSQCQKAFKGSCIFPVCNTNNNLKLPFLCIINYCLFNG